jgi:hypothetical protein
MGHDFPKSLVVQAIMVCSVIGTLCVYFFIAGAKHNMTNARIIGKSHNGVA